MIRPIGRMRSLLVAPAVRPDFVTRLAERGADAVVIDCEDATPPDAKSTGRANARELAPALAASCQVTVRVNSPATEWFLDDVRDGLCAELAAVVVPKIESIVDRRPRPRRSRVGRRRFRRPRGHRRDRDRAGGGRRARWVLSCSSMLSCLFSTFNDGRTWITPWSR